MTHKKTEQLYGSNKRKHHIRQKFSRTYNDVDEGYIVYMNM